MKCNVSTFKHSHLYQNISSKSCFTLYATIKSIIKLLCNFSWTKDGNQALRNRRLNAPEIITEVNCQCLVLSCGSHSCAEVL